ncbi:MAG TPA: hypothetical protein VE197_22725 [Mycobacterium sp.]|nr:hypothetical protein [Mycobacterium sp.]
MASGCALMMGLAVLGLALAPGAGAAPIPSVPTTLPTFVGKVANAQPIPPPGVPQNPFSAPNPFGSVHLDPWESDTSTLAGPLGRAPLSWSSRLTQARRHPLLRLGHFFGCGTMLFDSHGRLEATCLGKGEASLVLVAPVSLRVLAYMDLPITRSVTGGSTAYFYLDSHDRAVIATARKHIWVVAQTGPAAHPRFSKVADYDLSQVGSGARDTLAAIAPDWRGRIWFVTHNATVGVFDPAKYPAPDAIHQLALASGEQVSNGPAVTPGAGYFVTSQKMYRVAAGADGRPQVVWSAPYQTIGKVKPGQYSLGSGTSPTILDHGRYVAIADNANQLHVVVYRTAARLAPGQLRTVCQTPVFPVGLGADENSLIGSGRSLIAVNTYGFKLLGLWLRLRSTRSEPGLARVDINANGNGCHEVWNNRKIEDIATPRLSTKTGLVYVYARRVDPNHPLRYVGYWTAVDFRTGKTIWQRLAGTGRRYDAYYPTVNIGPKGILYYSAFDGLVALRDTR